MSLFLFDTCCDSIGEKHILEDILLVYLMLAVLCSALISIIMRLSTDKVSGNVSMLAMNYVMCLTIAGAYTGYGNLFPAGAELGPALGMGLVNGVLYLAGFVLLQVNVKKNGVVLSSIFMKLGLLVPMVISIFLFGEMPAAVQVIGFCVAVTAIVLINLEPEQSAMSFKPGLILLLLAGGGADAMSKVFEELGDRTLSSQFLFYTFGLALILCLGLMLWKKERPGKWEALFGLLIGIPNYFSARFLLLSLAHVPAVIAYPTFSVGTILVVTLAGVGFFKERLSKRQWIAVAAILVALVLLNV